MKNKLKIRGARQHNLKDIAVDIEKNKLQDLLKIAEEEANKTDISDQLKYLADQKVEVLKSLN